MTRVSETWCAPTVSSPTPSWRWAAPSSRSSGWHPLTGPGAPMTALATTEPGSGSDASSIRTTASRVEGRLPPQRAEGLDLQRRRGAVLRHLRQDRRRRTRSRGVRVRARQVHARNRRSGSPCARWASAPSSAGRSSSTTSSCPSRSASAPRVRGSRPDADVRHLAGGPGRGGCRCGARRLRVRTGLRAHARPVRQADHRAPGRGVPARGHGQPDRGRTAARPPLRHGARRRAGTPRVWRPWQS